MLRRRHSHLSDHGAGLHPGLPILRHRFRQERPRSRSHRTGTVGEAVARLGLKHVVITSVNRDDLPDGGASQFVACIEQVKQRSPLTTIELLIPDFCGNWDALATVMAAAPHVLNHNIETVPRMYRRAALKAFTRDRWSCCNGCATTGRRHTANQA